MKRIYSSLLALTIIPSLIISPAAASAPQATQAASKTVTYLSGQYKTKGVTAIDDWSVIGLAAVSEKINSAKWGGTVWESELIKRAKALDPHKTTDFARFIVTVVAAGYDPTNLGGQNLIDRLKRAQLTNGKFADSIDGQGQGLVNAHIWSIIACYVAGEQIPRATLAKAWLVSKQLKDGGYQFDTTGKTGGIDMTAMALLAFKALNMSKSDPAVSKALAFLKQKQATDGGFREGGTGNTESVANVISACIAWGENPQAWVKGNSDLLDNLLTFQKTDGSFSHTKGGGGNRIATAQALIGLADIKRGTSYVPWLREQSGTSKVVRLSDLSRSYWAYPEISYLVKNGYITGMTPREMKPDAQVTRAQFAALLLRAIGEMPNTKGKGTFRDVPASHWAAGTVEKAAALGLMQGSASQFRPNSPITHEEMATISSRVAKKYGWKKGFSAASVTVTWSQVSPWAKTGVQDLQTRRLLGGTANKKFSPKANVSRAEASVMLYRLLATR
ncbi:S-layer homology domain-containing protein [Brevibacillus dissolubilis]|uniref:S-layer homology domain-containing protein n=1 Tax=Brevibacillus dissolubilis TaxID=1844116 RepID=UPI00159BDF01|nr:S-layer homology domain-containing protein [Brevibacillus dissolubilis]